MTSYRKLSEVRVAGRRVLLRVDLNVPLTQEGQISSDFRIKCALPTIQYLVTKKAKIILLSHLGRVQTKVDVKLKSLRPVADRLKKLIPTVKINFINDIEGRNLEFAISNLRGGEILLMENTRMADVFSIDGSFDPKQQRESENSEQLGRYWASLGEVFVNDAFAMAHRAHASNVGIASFSPNRCIGFLIEHELKMLNRLVDHPTSPFLAFIGGAKVSDKIKLLERLFTRADRVVIGGAMAFTFLKAQGITVGNSLVEDEQLPTVKKYLTQFEKKIVLPDDFIVNQDSKTTTLPSTTPGPEIPRDLVGLDVGPKSIAHYDQLIQPASTIFWNGPFGLFEREPYARGSKALCMMLAKLKGCFRVIGGGDSVAMVMESSQASKFDFISSGGGATLAFISGEKLPGLKVMSYKF